MKKYLDLVISISIVVITQYLLISCNDRNHERIGDVETSKVENMKSKESLIEDSWSKLFDTILCESSVTISVREASYYDVDSELYKDFKLTIDDTSLIVQTDYIYDLSQEKIMGLIGENESFYLVFHIKDFVSNDKLHILRISDNRSLAEQHILNVGYFEDIDQDGYIEVGGIEYLDVYNHSPDSTIYIPLIIYELGDSVVIDSIATYFVNNEYYGSFLGFESIDTVLKINNRRRLDIISSSGKDYESFEEFLSKFYSDSTFQLSRIVFPLEGIDTEMMEMDDTIYYFFQDEWVILKDVYPDIKGAIREIIDVDNTKIDKFYIENSGFIMERWFRRNNGRWFLVYYLYANV